MLVKTVKAKIGTWLPLLHIVLCVSFGFVMISPASVLADTVGPSFSQLFPANAATVNQNKIVLEAVAKDADLVDMGSLVMTLDGVQVQANSYYTPIDESTEDYTTLNIYYAATLTLGSHTATVSIKDQYNNPSSITWSFTVAQPPKILSFSPANGATEVNRTPEIQAKVISGNGIDPGTVIMTLNDIKVNAVLDQVYGIISYQPDIPLDNETFYNVALSFKDTAGTTVNGSWQFYVNTFQEMTYSVDDFTCQKCHDRTAHLMTNCTKCHGINQIPDKPTYPLDDCYLCHYNSTNYPASYHPNGLPLGTPPLHPVQITYSCTDCHNKTWQTAIPSIHNIFTTAVEHKTTTTGCTECHSSSLTREHLRRLDEQGNLLTCFTCHNSPDLNVKNAIANRDSSCAACHGASTHPEHNNGLDPNCQTCHSSTILSEPQFHAKNDCSICHSNTDNPLVPYAISIGDSSCFSCHDSGHNVKFVAKAPSDIPLYSGFEWSQPQAVAPWTGETWFPAEFNSVGAKIMLSNHRTDVNGTDLFNWYTQNLADNGWQKVSGPSQGGENNFSLVYQKDNRQLNLSAYTGASRDTTGLGGYRVEIIWK